MIRKTTAELATEKAAQAGDQETGASTQEPTQNNDLVTDIFKEALDLPLETLAPNIKKANMTREQANKVLEVLGNTFSIPKNAAMVAVILLFLRGAASDGTPLSLSVTVMEREITKRDLLNAYVLVTNNKFLRRMAETMAVEIGLYAEKHQLSGELASRINRLHRAETGENLTHKEQAWCSSFSQNIPNLGAYTSERVIKLLSTDFNRRFAKKVDQKKADPKPGKDGKGTGKPNQKPGPKVKK